MDNKETVKDVSMEDESDDTGTYWTCCGHPGDGSSGGGCLHEGGRRVSTAEWQEMRAHGAVTDAMQ